MKTSHRLDLFWLVLAGLLSAAGAYAAFYAMFWGPWGYSDSAAYLASARNLAAGWGLSLPDSLGVLHFNSLTPPLYPALIALGVRAGADALGWAKALQVLLTFLYPLSAALLLWRASSKAFLAPITVIALSFFPPQFANAASAMSEQLFFTLGFSSLLALLLLSQARQPRRWLLLSALLAGLAALTRYLGLAFCLSGILFLLLVPPRRWQNAGLFALTSLSLPLIWLPITLSQGVAPGARSFSLEWAALANHLNRFLQSALQILSGWLPWSARGADVLFAEAKLLLFYLLLAGLALWLWRGANALPRRLLLLSLLFSGVYLLLYAASFATASIRPDLIARIFSPLWPAGWLILISLAWMAADRLPAHRACLAWAGLSGWLLLSCLYFFPQLLEQIRHSHHEGVGYTAAVWQRTTAFDFIETEFPDKPLISDEPALILLHTGRGAANWEGWIERNLAAERQELGAGNHALDERLRAGAALVLFPPRIEQDYGPTARTQIQKLTASLRLRFNSPECLIFTVE